MPKSYCEKTDCQWFGNCTQALTAKRRAALQQRREPWHVLAHCVYYYYSFEKRTKKK